LPIAFWTFAGFENLTFLAPELRDPGRDFLPVTAGSLVAYGTLTLVLTAALAATVPRAGVDRVTGLLQLADGADAHRLVSAAVAAIALAVVLLNTGAWVWGTSRVATDAARAGLLPAGLARTTSYGVPRRALGLLAAEFAVTGTVLVARPTLVVTAVRAASDVFVLLYVLCIAAYARTRGPSVRVALNAGVLAVLLVALVRSGVGAVYAGAALAVVAAARAIAPAASPSP
jgi:amino acid efflux transporter